MTSESIQAKRLSGYRYCGACGYRIAELEYQLARFKDMPCPRCRENIIGCFLKEPPKRTTR